VTGCLCVASSTLPLSPSTPHKCYNHTSTHIVHAHHSLTYHFTILLRHVDAGDPNAQLLLELSEGFGRLLMHGLAQFHPPASSLHPAHKCHKHISNTLCIYTSLSCMPSCQPIPLLSQPSKHPHLLPSTCVVFVRRPRAQLMLGQPHSFGRLLMHGLAQPPNLPLLKPLTQVLQLHTIPPCTHTSPSHIALCHPHLLLLAGRPQCSAAVGAA
jgi:hypothetical protein